MKKPMLQFLILSFLCFYACTAPTDKKIPEAKEEGPKPKIVFVTGDEEYRSEESMPMLAALAKRELGAEVTVCYALDSLGFIDPNNTHNIKGLEALKTADLMVMFTRFRDLPDEQLNYILDYVESGKPIMGFRTSTHPFLYKDIPEKTYLNEDWPIKVFGQKWITHHGHFEDGNAPLTEVTLYANEKKHPIMRGVQPFKAYSWLYHVRGEEHALSGDSEAILSGRSLRSNYAESGEFPLENPVAWYKTYTGTSAIPARVFFTTLGHPFDFKTNSMRKLSLNGIAWALGLEEKIPAGGLDVEIEYEPSNSGFGDKYKKVQRPQEIE